MLKASLAACTVLLASAFATVSSASTTGSAEERCATLQTHVEAFRRAMVEADAPTLLNLTDNNLSFGHSNGVIQTKEEFVKSVAMRDEVFNAIDLLEKTSRCDGSVAIERHVFKADILLGSTPLNVALSVLEVWRHNGAHWVLVARQAFAT